MGETKLVNVGVDTLVLNVFYADERGRPFKRDLDLSLRLHLDEWKRAAIELHDEYPTTLIFNGAVLHMSPNGAGQGQWPCMLKTKDITLYISGGHWNGIASVRFSSQYLWSCKGILDAMVCAHTFLDGLFENEMFLQASSIDLCVDVAGWEDVGQLDRVQNFINRSRKRSVRDESDWMGEVKSRDYSMGFRRTGFDFPGIDTHQARSLAGFMTSRLSLSSQARSGLSIYGVRTTGQKRMGMCGVWSSALSGRRCTNYNKRTLRMR